MGYRGRAAYNQGGMHSEMLPHLKSYADALQYHNKVVPLRSGQFKGQRPLGRLRRYTRSMIRVEGGVSPAAPDVVLSYYKNDVIRFKPDNTAHLSTCGWPSLSTMQFLNDVLWDRMNRFVRKNRRIYCVDKNGHYLITPEAPVIIDLSTGAVTGGDSVDTFVLNKSEMHKVRKGYREFLQYAHNCLAMSVAVPVPVPDPTVLGHRKDIFVRVTKSHFNVHSSQHQKLVGEQQDMRSNIFGMINSTEGSADDKLLRYYEAFKIIAGSAKFYMPWSAVRNNPQEIICGRNYFDAIFTGMLKLHYADQLFQKVTHTSPMKSIPDGQNQFFVQHSKNQPQ